MLCQLPPPLPPSSLEQLENLLKSMSSLIDLYLIILIEFLTLSLLILGHLSRVRSNEHQSKQHLQAELQFRPQQQQRQHRQRRQERRDGVRQSQGRHGNQAHC